MIIGNFKSVGASYTGTIQTLTFTAKVAFTPAAMKSDKAPDYRVSTGHTELGAAWKKTSDAGNEYLSVQLDDPSLPAPIQCALVKTGTEGTYSLVWERRRKRA
jgi:uncharacterized protein (DUF736 family)